jgi:hypothetical protein
VTSFRTDSRSWSEITINLSYARQGILNGVEFLTMRTDASTAGQTCRRFLDKYLTLRRDYTYSNPLALRALPVTRHELFIDQFYRRIAGWCILRQSVAAITVWAFLWGTAVLVLRATQDIAPVVLLWGLIGVPIAVALALRFALRQLPDRSSVRALLDGRGECGGLLMAGAECDLGRWAEAVPVVAMPRVSWNCRRPLTILATSIGYVLLGFLLPIDRSTLAGDSLLDVDRETDRLGEQVRVLKEEKILDPDRAETLKQKLDQVRASSAGKDPAKTLEALDHLNDVVRQAARKASEASAREANQLGKLETSAEAMHEAAKGLDEKTTTALMAELSAMTQKAAAENEQFKEGIDGDLAAALAKGKLSPEQLSKLVAAARAGKDAIRKSAQKLYNAKLIDADQLKECNGECKCDSKSLAEFLKKNDGKSSLRDAIESLDGRGGVSDDLPGNTPIQFGDRSSENGAKFREEILPPASLAALKESQVAGVSIAEPQRDPKAGSPSTGALAGTAAGGGSANTGQVLPQHKAPVERYFDRSGK